MAGEHGDPVYSLGLLRDTTHWSVPVALIFALVGSALTRDLRFGISCLIGAAADIGTLALALRSAKGTDPREALSGGPLATALLGRLALKAVLLVTAFLLPAWLSLWGMAAGVLTVDLTIATAGSAAAAYHAFRPHRSGG